VVSNLTQIHSKHTEAPPIRLSHGGQYAFGVALYEYYLFDWLAAIVIPPRTCGASLSTQAAS
jgi:hypothetical protein